MVSFNSFLLNVLAFHGCSKLVNGATSGRPLTPSPASPSSVSSRSTSASTLVSESCPSYKTKLRTTTSTTYVNNPKMTTRTTITFTQYSSTTTIVSSTDWTTYDISYTATQTSTLTDTVTTISVAPATKTVTVPTPRGFTPVLCLPNYRDVTSTATRTVFTEPTAEITVSAALSTWTDYVYTTTFTSTGTYNFPLTIYEDVTTTVTSKRTNPTSSVYAACASNNITPRGPNGDYLRTRLTLYGDVEQVTVPALDLIDCCAGCQANSSCTAMTAYPANAARPDIVCFWYMKTATSSPKCDGSFKSVKITPGFFLEDPVLYVADSPCGQVTVD